MKTVTVDLKTIEDASRTELFVRLIYWIPLVIVWFFLAIISGVLILVNIVSILIAGKRVGTSFIKKAWQYQAKVNAYYWLMTDERPPITPE